MMPSYDMSLRSLEVFHAIADTGSIQQVASDTGLSISTVSHHLRTLEEKLGVALIDHGRRPMIPTPAGAIFLRHVDEALRSLRRGRVELTSSTIEQVKELRLGVIDDFDGEVAPELAQALAQVMPSATFRHRTRPSHEVLGLLARGEIDIAVAAAPQDGMAGMVEYPLLRDPFVVVAPVSPVHQIEDLMARKVDLPFLHYPKAQMIGQQVDAQLRRLRLNYPRRYEIESNQMLHSMVAGGMGWTITTAASFMRVKRLHSQLLLSPLPTRKFSRVISMFTTDIYSETVVSLLHAAFRRLIAQRFVDPAINDHPWLSGSFLVLSAIGADDTRAAEPDES